MDASHEGLGIQGGSAGIVILSERGRFFQNASHEKVLELAGEDGSHQS
jgi:hypothetical protein